MTLDATTRMSHARTNLLLDHVWFGSLAMRLRLRENPKSKNITVNGTLVEFNAEYVDSLTDKELQGVFAHQVMHCALKHMFRRGHRNLKMWNDACDYAINPLLEESGIQLPDDALKSPRFANMAAEQIYAILQEEENQGGKGPGEKGSSTGSFEDPSPSGPEDGDGDGEDGEGNGDGQQDMSEIDWEIAVEQASMIAAKAGKLPAGIKYAIDKQKTTKTNWKELLRRFIEKVIPRDYSWSHPNRRFAHQGLYLPGITKDGCPPLAIGNDTSGSIPDAYRKMIAAEVQSIMNEVRPESIDVIHCDSAVHGIDHFDADDADIVLNPGGYGGTDFRPVFVEIDKLNVTPAACIFFTDLEGPFPDVPPDYPVLWIVPEMYPHEAPFGETVKVSLEN